MYKLSDCITRKFIETIDVTDWEIESDSGWVDVTASNKTVMYQVWEVTTHTGRKLKCADTHILFTESLEEVFAKDSLGVWLATKDGPELVVELKFLDIWDNMYDLTVDHPDHRYYTDGFLSHNTQTVAAYLLWYTLFNSAVTVAILANKGAAAREILDRYQEMYEGVPYYLQKGVRVWNKGSLSLENKSKLFTGATSAAGIRGKSCNLVYVDECAIIPNNVADAFFTATYPTISSGDTTKVILTSTPLGYNHFWKFWNEAQKGVNGFKPVEVKYHEHPKRDEHWAAEQRAMLGDLKYNQEVCCNFLGSSSTLIDSGTIAQLSSIYPLQSYKQGQSAGLDIFEVPNKGSRDGSTKPHSYVITVDTSKGLGQDYSAFSVIDVTTTPYRLVAKYKNNTIAPLMYPNVIYKVAREYNDAFVLFEINASEQVPYILYSELEYENVLFVYTGKMGQTISAGFGGASMRHGLNMDKKTKRIGCSNLKSMIEQKQLLIFDQDIISELSTFIQVKDSYAADEGYHDDLVMTLVIFAWLTTQTYFKDLTDIDLRKAMYQQHMDALDSEQLPAGFYNDGIPSETKTMLNF